MAYSDPGAVDPRRVLVNAPLSSRTEISIENRSLDGGKTFRLLYDRTCAERSRPTCLTGGGGDAEEDVNLKNGNLFFADQEVLVQEALASSTDHGDTFPADRQFPITNTATVLDRQWLAATDSSFKAGPPLLKKTVEAFLAYHLAGVGQYVQAIDPTGMPMEQLLPQIPEVAQSGQLRVDNSQGPGHQWIYQPYAALIGGTRVATAFGPDYGLPTSWQSTAVTADLVTSFPWIALDDRGNAYLTWDTGGAVYYSASPIDDARNDPSAGGRPGSYWTPRVQLSPPQIGSAVFPEAIGGAPGRFGVTYVGTTEFIGEPDDAPQDTHWNTYAAVVTNALGVGGPPVVHTGQVSHRFVHHGNICTSGTACAATMKDRSFADLIDVGRFQNGQLGVVYQDNFSTFADTSETTGDGEDEAPFIVFARQVSGPDLSGPAAGPEANHVFATVDDAGGDATWPNWDLRTPRTWSAGSSSGTPRSPSA